MSIHLSAKEGEIAPIVLLAGDPLRTKHISENYLQNLALVSSTRNAYYYTGTYKGVRLTIGASGMGCPSIGIYSYELYNFYNVQCIMRIGTCGAYFTNIQLFDLINAERAYSESTYAKYAFGFEDEGFKHQGVAYEIINRTAERLDLPLLKGAIHSGDPFYRIDPALPKIVVDNHCLAAEMEAFALFANAKHFNRTAATLLTVSDVIPNRQMITAGERERSLEKMTHLALESVIDINNNLE
ncbi:MAG: purine-nucleoside phosphorylase [Candidatus Dadabacteria bacterium]